MEMTVRQGGIGAFGFVCGPHPESSHTQGPGRAPPLGPAVVYGELVTPIHCLCLHGPYWITLIFIHVFLRNFANYHARFHKPFLT
jgi:hypothetical protein